MEYGLHKSVLLSESIHFLNIKPNGVYVDCTMGGCGHSLEILKHLKTGKLIAIDKDPDAILESEKIFKENKLVEVIKEDFFNLKQILREKNIKFVDGILIDLGVSSHQLDNKKRGFSYRFDSELDMRMSKSGKSAKDVVNFYTLSELEKIFKKYGEEKFSYYIAKKIVNFREKEEIVTTLQLFNIIKSALPSKVLKKDKNPAKKVFQALRIEVNDEINALNNVLKDGFSLLNSKGRFCIISFHSLEDKEVKRAFLEFQKGCKCPPDFPICVCNNKKKANVITKKPILPSENEIESNKRSKSAKLRVLEKI